MVFPFYGGGGGKPQSKTLFPPKKNTKPFFYPGIYLKNFCHLRGALHSLGGSILKLASGEKKKFHVDLWKLVLKKKSILLRARKNV